MAKLTEKEREGFERILEQDLDAINEKFMTQLKDFWTLAKEEVKKTQGWDKLEAEAKELEEKKREILERLHEIESAMRSEGLTVEQVVELGGKPDEYSSRRYVGANFYGIPITSQFDYKIVEYIRKNIDLEVPVKILRDVCRSSVRALTMAGTFEEAREAYDKFYSLDFRKYGVDIPPRLDDVKKDAVLLETAKQTLVLGEGKEQPKLPQKKDEVEVQ